MCKIEFKPVAFTDRDYFLLSEAESNAFSLSLPLQSANDLTMTIDGQRCNEVLSKYLFDKVLMTMPAEAFAFIGSLIAVIEDYNRFFTLCHELIYENMMLATVPEVKDHLFEMEGRLNHFLFKLDKRNNKPLLEGCMLCYSTFMSGMLQKCAEIKLLPLNQQKARYKACLHEAQASCLGKSWKILGINNFISTLKEEIKDVEMRMQDGDDGSIWHIENEPKEVATLFAKLFHNLRFFIKPGKPKVEQKEFIERMMGNFMNQYNCPYEKKSMYVMFSSRVKKLGRVFTKK